MIILLTFGRICSLSVRNYFQLWLHWFTKYTFHCTGGRASSMIFYNWGSSGKGCYRSFNIRPHFLSRHNQGYSPQLYTISYTFISISVAWSVVLKFCFTNIITKKIALRHWSTILDLILINLSLWFGAFFFCWIIWR